MEDIKINDIIEVVITGIQKYGAFVLINDKYDGLIHISEISSGYVKNINDYIKIKDKIYAQVVDIDSENNKVKLSIKNIDYRNDGKIINTDDNYSKGFEPYIRIKSNRVLVVLLSKQRSFWCSLPGK